MKVLSLFFAVCVAAVLSGCATGRGSTEAPKIDPAAQAVSTYKIGVDDQLQVTVWQNPDLSVSVPVRPDGKITVPLIGDVMAGGKTPDTAAARQLIDRSDTALRERLQARVKHHGLAFY